MITKTVNYTNYFGKEVQEDLYFNLTQNELVDMRYGDFRHALEVIQSGTASDGDLIDALRSLILASYGRISMDGNRFEKSKELSDQFEQSIAFDTLFMELAKDSDKLINFMTGIMPKELQSTFKAEIDKAGQNAITTAV